MAWKGEGAGDSNTLRMNCKIRRELTQEIRRRLSEEGVFKRGSCATESNAFLTSRKTAKTDSWALGSKATLGDVEKGSTG